MECLLCGHPKAHKHSRTSKGSQRYRCPQCRQTFSETFDKLYYRRWVSAETVQTVLQTHAEGSSLRGVSRLSAVAYNTSVSLRAASQKAQLVHNAGVQAVEAKAVCADELWSFVEKNRNSAWPGNRKPEIAGLP
jgi:transposase-like protein